MFSVRITLAITRRILREVFRDTRASIFLLVAPGVLIVLVRNLFESAADFAPTGAMMLGAFPALSMYMVGSTLVVRERNRGTLEAILATPASRLDFVLAYLCAAVAASLVQAVSTVAVGYTLGGLETASPPWLLGAMAALCAIFGMSLGLICSAICQNEGQASQLVPGIMVPQLLICGVFWPLPVMADWLRAIERFMPFSTVTRAMTAAREHSYGGSELVVNSVAMAVLTAAALLGVAAIIRRRTA
ncbi:ABC transporter permease [Actinomadura soli]|uniref:ABC transporter permease n=1 Tax=Actinomadura soli TaxID=2508997 RepID=UPI00148756FD|nr:ABC transporter permease [Actinomadura soli]